MNQYYNYNIMNDESYGRENQDGRIEQRLSKRLIFALRKSAKNMGITPSEWIRRAIIARLKLLEDKDK